MSIEFVGNIEIPSLLRSISKGWAVLTKSERRRVTWVWVLIMVDGLIKTIALTAIVPFVLTAVDPNRVLGHPKFKEAIDFFGIASPTELLVLTGVLLMVLVLFKNLFSWFTLGVQNRFCGDCEARQGQELLERVLNAPYAWTLQHNSQTLRLIVLNHVAGWARAFLRSILMLGNDLIFSIMTMGVLIYASPRAGIMISVLGIALSWALVRGIQPTILRYAEIKRMGYFQVSILGTHAIAGLKDVKMTGSEAFFLSEYGDTVKLVVAADNRLRQWQQLPRMSIETIGYGAMIGLIVIALSSGVAPGELATILALYVVAAMRLMPILSTVVSNFSTILNVLPMIEEMRHLIAETESSEAVRSVPTNPSTGVDRFADWQEISATGLGYTYKTGKQSALHDVDVRFEFGKVYGLAGPSGAGKSTLIDILSGLLEPQQGEISIDGTPLSRAQLHQWRSKIGYVSQLPFMLDATLRENIAFGLDRASVDEKRVTRIIKLTKLAELVAELPDGLDTRIGESAVRLSGGQRQRVAIARALYQDIRLLIFDEATSALDSLTERDIRNTIEGLAGELTVILIAHRMSTIADCDKIFVLDEGRVIAEGRYEVLSETCPLFRDMASEASSDIPVDVVAAK